ncbi:hypothetical protein A2Z67_02610 [Candidatus Woesebacteria bacterium RBG_13_36_22]|uniref:Uncharacterized protein n=1 Tax=Candidatus Woesebacteria bacterium RBG_13_36_22 TaxID=1802478 RepID=A0A1F7X1M8_9BACT|nr:MAG: hypothetical protein A2Z67_02610 [Candidatus Woesebacteria bacterium RBG_13_36_22]
MEQLKKNQDYKYTIIAQFAQENECEIENYGNFIIGENLLILRDEDNRIMSFILTGATFDHSIYTCVYNDFET